MEPNCAERPAGREEDSRRHLCTWLWVVAAPGTYVIIMNTTQLDDATALQLFVMMEGVVHTEGGQAKCDIFLAILAILDARGHNSTKAT